jgi:hypothetical protein
MSDLYNSILQLVRQNGYREFEKEYMNVKEYMKEEARYILGILENDNEKIIEIKEESKKVVENEIVHNIETIKEDTNIYNNDIKVLNFVKEDKVIVAEVKNQQRKKEKERREYMKKNGIKLEDLFTKENIEKWLKEGRSYAWIASDQLGCKQEDVSKYVKLNGIKI